MARVTVVGAGAWGTALAVMLARNGHTVVLAVRRPTRLAALTDERENKPYLPGVQFPPELKLTGLGAESLRDAEAVLMAIPSAFAREVMATLAGAIPPDASIISVSKGIQPESLLTMSQMLGEVAPPFERVVVLSGPGFASEVARGQPTALVVAAESEDTGRKAQSLFSGKSLRVYRSLDKLGVELGGASKNVIAIAAGISDGLGLGTGARAALITRGLAEMMRLAQAAGGKRETLAGLAGMGDLVLTCTGDLSRNRRIGLAMGRGEALPAFTESRPVAEGVANACAVRSLAERLGVEVPIVSAVYRIIYEAASPKAMVDGLLGRELKAEF